MINPPSAGMWLNKGMPFEMSWLGNAGFAFTFGRTRLLIDPFFSRPPAARLFAGRVRPDADALREHATDCDAILISHAHFDHFMDAPAIALSCGARLYASANACAIARACGVPERQIIQLKAGDEFVVHRLRARTIAARHPWIPGYTAGQLPADLNPPLRLRDYRMDECFSFFIQGPPSVLVWSSTSARGACRADVLICRAVATTGWYRELLDAVRPALVIPCHWDDMFRPLSEPPAPFFAPPRAAFPPVGRIDLEEFRGRITRAMPGCRVLLPERLRAYALRDLPT